MIGHRPLLVLTMPGFGIETLRHLVATPAWPASGVMIALIGSRPPAWKRATAVLRRCWQARADRVHRLADGTLAAIDAERFLSSRGLPFRWLDSDAAVARLRAELAPALTLTITSRIVFSPSTLAASAGSWFNVHPGLLPEYPGASPAPYMFVDGVGGCTIHQMAERVDAGAIVDRAPMTDVLGEDIGEYFFVRLPRHTAGRVANVFPQFDGACTPPTVSTMPAAGRSCSSLRLAADRQLDWQWPADRLVRWVRALSAVAPPWWVDAAGRRVEVMEATAGAGDPGAPPGTVLGIRGRWLDVAVAGGVVTLRCRTCARVRQGEQLPVRGRGGAA